MAKKNTVLFKLEAAGTPGFFFVKKKNPKKATEKMEFRKYNPVTRKHEVFKEKKLSS
jgi:large subunit ribosomal protein L33